MAATLGSTARTRIVNKNQKKKPLSQYFFRCFAVCIGTVPWYIIVQVVLLWGNGHYTCTLLRTRYLQTKTTYICVYVHTYLYHDFFKAATVKGLRHRRGPPP